jgi:hypothetical protein
LDWRIGYQSRAIERSFFIDGNFERVVYGSKLNTFRAAITQVIELLRCAGKSF